MPISVLLVDDNALFRDGIVHILQRDGRFDVVGQVSRGDEAVTAAADLQPDLILMDLQMPGMNGVDAIRAIRTRDATVPIGVLTMFETAEHVESALAAGASGYVAKDATPADFCAAATALAGGKRDVMAIPSASTNGTPAARSSLVLARLSERELDVLRALTAGASNEMIARSLGISPKTLRNHISRIYHKLRIFDRAQAVIVAVREGLVEIQPP
jgi:DNA-binding NarL/FixJ family response regulator